MMEFPSPIYVILTEQSAARRDARGGAAAESEGQDEGVSRDSVGDRDLVGESDREEVRAGDRIRIELWAALERVYTCVKVLVVR